MQFRQFQIKFLEKVMYEEIKCQKPNTIFILGFIYLSYIHSVK